MISHWARSGAVAICHSIAFRADYIWPRQPAPVLHQQLRSFAAMTSTEALSNSSDILKNIIKDAASTLQSRNTTLNWHWLNVRNIIVDLVTHTIALGMFSSFDHINLWEATLILFSRSVHIYCYRIALHSHVRATL